MEEKIINENQVSPDAPKYMAEALFLAESYTQMLKFRAGDAFCSGIVYQAYQGADLETALRFATAVGGLSLTGDTGYASIVPAEGVWEFERRMRERDR